jgi:hypothetical protein
MMAKKGTYYSLMWVRHNGGLDPERGVEREKHVNSVQTEKAHALHLIYNFGFLGISNVEC